MGVHRARRRILVATTNPGKVKELKAMLNADAEWVGLSAFPSVGEIHEYGATFAENARQKAIGYAKATGLWTIADDSGLVVDALGGQPGVRSARFSGQRPKDTDRGLIDHKNIAKVLELLKGVPRERRTARFVCCLCLASPEKVLAEAEGALEGLIGKQELGTNGFGYDPVFFVPSLDKTFAQLSEEEKNAISHRGQAIKKLGPMLEHLLRGKDTW